MGGYFSSKSSRTSGETITYNKTFTVFLMGAPKSGKSTIFRQLQLLSGVKIDDETRRQRREDIRQYVLDAMTSILTAMPKLSPPVMLGSLQSEIIARFVLDRTEFDGENLPKLFSLPNFIKTLWLDEGVQEAYRRGNEYDSADNAPYFFVRIDRICRSDYLPSDEDLLRCPTLKVSPEHLDINPTIFNVQESEVQDTTVRIVDHVTPPNRLPHFDIRRVSIVFVVDCSSYNITSKTNPSKSQLQENFDYFEHLTTSRRGVSVHTILNKGDRLQEKILSGHKMEDHFPDFERFRCAGTDVVRARDFIINKLEISGSSSLTCALDAEDIRSFFTDHIHAILTQTVPFLDPK
ncbi:G-alpha domain containing protein [Asbolus verrucosus]|uniref:Adenylate cyclase-stimulating G alpha protein n=1 Tax=Asbolus verrucosus TaxID=1661398 RepID=A0A482VX87_ASBVE|nr:G-alpha domain containing protein [Asbolus verrucosus]